MQKHMKACLLLAIAAGTAVANDPITTDTTPAGKIAGHVYINLATGERTIVPAGGRYGPAVWSNTGSCVGSFFWGGWTAPTNQEAIDWGSITNGVVIDGYQIAYATNLPDPASSGVPGFDAINYFYDDYLGFGNTGTVAAAFRVGPLPGSYDGQYWGWIVTIDLAGGFEFTLAGNDANCFDGLHEFGWGCAYNIPMAGFVTGPLPVTPMALGPCGTTAACSTGTATGVEDAFDLYFEYPQTNYDNTYNFGGFPAASAGSFYMELYGSAASCPPDWNGDTTLNTLDFIAFLNDFAAGSADYNGDTTTDSLDFLAFLNDFVAGC
jgi:hypothetical protein